MADPGADQWQILFPEGLTETQADRLSRFASDSDIGEPLSVDERTVFRYDYDRATVELYRHLFQKILDGAELSASDRLTLSDHLAELDDWTESSSATE